MKSIASARMDSFSGDFYIELNIDKSQADKRVDIATRIEQAWLLMLKPCPCEKRPLVSSGPLQAVDDDEYGDERLENDLLSTFDCSTISAWQNERNRRLTGNAAVRLPFKEWLERRHGILIYRLTQVLTGHGSFVPVSDWAGRNFRNRYKKEGDLNTFCIGLQVDKSKTMKVYFIHEDIQCDRAVNTFHGSCFLILSFHSPLCRDFCDQSLSDNGFTASLIWSRDQCTLTCYLFPMNTWTQKVQWKS
uniref:SFRICE_004013 n=1 Tax=Spodoptera frugiperda TaxID=7108 RepID=A0A2H1VKV7_SPOFR